MKKIFLTLALGLVTVAYSQQGNCCAQQQKGRPTTEEIKQKQEQHLVQMQKDLKLSSEQISKIKALQEKNNAEREANRAKMEEMRKQRQQEMQAKRDAHDAEMKKILSPEQYDKWQKQRLENMQKQRDMWKNKAMRKGMRHGAMNLQNSPKN